MNRIRVRFSMRTLVILITLVGTYFGAWEATKRYGCRGLIEDTNESSPFPFVIRHREQGPWGPDWFDTHGEFGYRDSYYIWLFGAEFKLPFESTW